MKKIDSNRRQLSGKAGFTLMEMILVIALMMLLAGVAVVKLTGVLTDNEIKLTKIKVEQSFKTALFKYRMDTGSYPTTEQGLRALLQKPGNDRGKWHGPYIEGEDNLEDAWGRELKYRYPSSNNPGSYDLYSLGADGVESGDDIKNWK